jgi:uncharacterized protein YeeX (DUF496 family)
MYEEYRVREKSDFHTVVNTFTQGLRELPTDYVTRVKSFLAEYLGSPQHPVPFGGRSKDFAYLDNWLTDSQASPYLLLAAPAGRGKSALLVRWCQRLLAQQDLAVAYFPVSIRFRTNLAGVSFPSLVALLARLHGEKVPADPNMHEEVWRGLFVDYITRPLPDKRALVLILDGVDEAADWMVGPDLFPLNPPPGLRIVLSARHLANDEDASAWLKRLGWTRPGLASTLELYPLDRSGIVGVLTQMGFPLNLLSMRVNIVSELYRLSEGDPLLVRLYVDDLWERGEAAVRFQPEDLRTIRPGLAGYFERWWKDQRLLWSKEAPQREAAAQIVLNLLAGALGPLSKEDILSLLTDETGFRIKDLEQHLVSLARFITGDGIRQGYVFSHPRLGNYFLEERLSAAERQEIEHRFLAWGEQTLAALNAGSLAPEKASTYIVQYYGAHLERAQADTRALLGLVGDGWRRAWEKLDRANAGFLSDVERAWRAAEHEDSATTSTGNLATYLGAEIRCLLSQVSVNSMTSNISPRLMLEAVKTGIWTPAQGLACIRLITDLAPRARELVGLAPYVQEPLRTNILQEALDTVMTIKDEYTRLDTLVELSASFSAELLWQVLEIIPAVEDEADRAGALSELAPSLSSHQALLEKSLEFVQEIQEEEYRALALEGLAPYFLVAQHGHVLQLARMIREERYRAQTLRALIPHLTESFLQDILQEAHSMQDGLARMRLLTKLVRYLPEQLQAEALQEALELERDIDDREYRIEMLVGLAPFLPATKLQQGLQEIQLLLDESYRARSLNDLVQYIPAELHLEFLRAIRGMRSEEYRTKVLRQLLPRLSETLLEQVLDIAQATWDEGCLAELLAQLAPYASETLLPRLLEIVTTIEDQGYCVWLLAELQSSLGHKLHARYLNRLDVFDQIKDKEERLQTLLAILPRLSSGALAKIFSFILPELFDFTWRVRSEESRAHILTKLASRLPEKRLPIAMETVRSMGNEMYQVQVLLALAPRLGETLLSEALDIVRGMKDKDKRAQVLAALVSSLPKDQKGEKIQEMLQMLQTIKDETERVHVVVASAPYLSGTLPPARAQTVIAGLQAMLDEKNQVRIQKALAPHMSVDMLEEMLERTQKLQGGEERVEMLEALAPLAPPRFFPRLLNLANTLQNKKWRVKALTTVVSHAPQSIIVNMLESMPNIQDEDQRVEVLGVLGPYTPPEYLARLWEAVQAISNQRTRLSVLVKLAPRMPEEFFPHLWNAVQTVPSATWQMLVLKVLAPHMSEDLFPQVRRAIQVIEDEEKRALMLVVLAPHVPEHFFFKFWQATQTIPDKMMRWQLLEALAPSVPKAFFPQFFAAVQAISYQEVRIQVLIALIPHAPDEFFPQLWKTVHTMPNKRLQTRMLEELVARAPMHILPAVGTTESVMRLTEALEMVQGLAYGEKRIEITEALMPYLSEEMYTKMLEELLPPQLEERSFEAFLRATWQSRWHMQTLAILLPRLPREKLLSIVPTLLKVLRLQRAEDDKAWILKRMASNVPEELLQDMLEAIWSLNTVQYQMQVLESLFQSLSQTTWVKVLALATAKTRATGNVSFTTQVLKAADHFVQQSPPSLLYPVLHDIFHILAQYTRRDTLVDLARLAPVIRAVGGAEAIAESCCAPLEVGGWWP